MKSLTPVRRWVAAFGTGCVLALSMPSQAVSAGFGRLGILDTSGINPKTGKEWAVGDEYRLVFISGGVVDAADGSLGDLNRIETWNALAQNFAKNSNLALDRVTWRVIGSTVDVDARDNTATNPDVYGDGHPIMLIDGKTVIAADFSELWSGEIRNPILLDENSVHISRLPIAPWPGTGTSADGTAHLGRELRLLGEKGKISQGQAENKKAWIDRRTISVLAHSREPNPIYVMSEKIDVIPEPASALWMGLAGVAGIAMLRRR